MDGIREQIKTLFDNTDKLSLRVDELERHTHQQDLSDLKREAALKEAITAAVKDGIRKSSESLLRLETKLTEFMRTNEARIANAEKRIHDLEIKETKLLAAQAEQRIKDKAENRRQFFRTAVAAIIGFFVALILNNGVDLITHLLGGK